MSYLKADPARAQIIARSSTSARVLSRYARDSRVTARRLVAANDHTDLETNRYLHAWAWKRQENQVLVDTSGRLPVTDIRAALSEGYKGKYPWRAARCGTQRRYR